MSCKKHPLDLSSVVGVCASCLRERLSAQAQVEAQQERNYHYHHHRDGTRLARVQSRDTATEVGRKSDSHAPPPPLLFPRSVTPHVSYKKSDDTSSSGSHHQRFYSTPQVGPTFTSSSSTAALSASRKKKHGNRFSFFTTLFWSRSEKLNPDPRCNGPWICPADSSEPSSSSSPLWFSELFSGRHKKQPPPMFSSEFSGPIRRKPRRRTDRGMSPARSSRSDDDCYGSPSDRGRSPECWQAWRKTPMDRRGKSVHSRNVSGWAFCLTPMVRASPSKQWNQKGGLPPDVGFSCEERVQGTPHLSKATSSCANRSRKLVGFGKVKRNR